MAPPDSPLSVGVLRGHLADGACTETVYERTADAAAAIPSVDTCAVFAVEGGDIDLRASAGSGEQAEAALFALAEEVRREGREIHRSAGCADVEINESPLDEIYGVPIGSEAVLVIGTECTGEFEDAIAAVEILAAYSTKRVADLHEQSKSGPDTRTAREFLDLADVMLIAIDDDGTISYTNPKARANLGYAEGELVGCDWFERCIPDGQREQVREVFDQFVSGDSDQRGRFENSVVTADGDLRRIEWHNTALRDADGCITGTLSSGLDVTERRREHRRYETLVENFPNGIVTLFDEEYRYRAVGGTVFDRLDIQADELEGKRLDEVFPEENVSTLATLYDRAFQGQSSEAEVSLAGEDIRIHIVPIRDDDGDVVAGMTMSQVVTERKARKRELEAAERRFRTMLRAVPDPLFVADANSGKIIETNDAAECLRGEPREEILGLRQTDLHPSDDAEMYRTAFERQLGRGETVRRLPDGSQMYAVAEGDERVPVEISTATAKIADRRVVFGVFRDISDQLAHERALTGLNEASRDLFRAETPREVAECVVDSATDVLDVAGASVFSYHDADGTLRPLAHRLEDVYLDAEIPVFEPGESIAARVFARDESVLFDDVRTDDDVHNPETPFRSEIIVPIDEWGILIVGDTREGAFDEQTLDLVEILGATAAAAIERAQRQQALEARERRLEQRTNRLETVESINAQVRDVADAIVQSETRREIEETVCSYIADADPFEFVWFGDYDPGHNCIERRAWDGQGADYLQDVSLGVEDGSDGEPAVRAYERREPITISNIASDLAGNPWRHDAMKQGFRSAMSIPLIYQNSFQGILTVFSDADGTFSGMTQSVLNELGQLVAHALVALDRKQALLAHRGMELEFDIQDDACVFSRFARKTNCAFELEGVVPQEDGSSLAMVRLTNGGTADLIEAVETNEKIGRVRILEDGTNALIQLHFVEPFIASILANQGIKIRNISADESGARIKVAVPPTFDAQGVVDLVATLYPQSEFRAKRSLNDDGVGDMSPVGRIIDEMSARQREVLETAFRKGYFESPRQTSSEALAEDLDIAQSTFHYHVRKVENLVFESLFDAEWSEQEAI